MTSVFYSCSEMPSAGQLRYAAVLGLCPPDCTLLCIDEENGKLLEEASNDTRLRKQWKDRRAAETSQRELCRRHPLQTWFPMVLGIDSVRAYFQAGQSPRLFHRYPGRHQINSDIKPKESLHTQYRNQTHLRPQTVQHGRRSSNKE